MSDQREKLSVSGLDTANFHYRWFNDIDERLFHAKQAGYEFVQKSEIKSAGDPTIDTSQGTDTRIRKGVGGGKVAYLMKLPMEFRKDDEAKKEAEILETERAMRKLKTQTGHSASQGADYGSFEVERK
jgi:hypothetical protein